MSIKLYDCSCHCEGISLESVEGEVYLSVWERGYGPIKVPFKYRLKYVWTLLTKGSVYSDQITFSPGEAKKLGEKILELADESQKYIEEEIRKPRKSLEEVYKELHDEDLLS